MFIPSTYSLSHRWNDENSNCRHTKSNLQIPIRSSQTAIHFELVLQRDPNKTKQNKAKQSKAKQSKNMHSFVKAASLVLLVSASNAFTVAPPPPAQEMLATTVVVSSPTFRQSALLSTSNLPSPRELLLSSSSITLSSAAAAPAVPAAKTANLATTGVSIADINYDGKVKTTEADEYVVITNGSNSPVDVSGYYLYVATTGTQGPTFSFPKKSSIKPNSSVRIYTNELHKETGGYSFGSGKAIWNNRGGLAVLKDSNGKKLGEFKYKPQAS